MKAAIDNKQTNEHGDVPINIHLWTLKLKLHIILEYYKISLFYFFQSLKYVNTILVCGLYKKYAVGKMWIINQFTNPRL